MVLNGAIAPNVANVERAPSPAPKANKDLDKAKFYDEIAKAKNAMALGVRVNAIVMCLDEAECFFDTKALDPNPNDLTT